MGKEFFIFLGIFLIFFIGFLHLIGITIEEDIEAKRNCANDLHLKGDTSIGIVKDFETNLDGIWYCTVTFDNETKKQYQGQLCSILETKKILVDDGYNCGVGYNTYKMIALDSQEQT